jgi:flavorubredoxin
MREFIDGKMKSARPKGKIGAAFGTYKWNTDNLRRLETAMEYADINLVAPGVNALHRPRSEDDARLKALGEAVGREVLKHRT